MRFLLDLVEHRLGEIEALLALVALGGVRTALVLLVGHSGRYCDTPTAGESRGLPPARLPVPGRSGRCYANPMSRALVGAARMALAAVACASCGSAATSASLPPGSRGSSGAGDAADATTAETGSRDAASYEESLDWCDAQGAAHTFCEDFDHGVPGGLTSKTYGGATVAADVSDFASPPESMWTSTPTLLGPHATAGAFGTSSFVTAAPHLRVQADLQIASSCAENVDGVTLVMLTLDAYSVSIRTALGTSSLVELSYAPDGGLASSASHRLTAQIPNNAWTTVVLEVDRSAREADVTVAGAPTLMHQPLSLAPSIAAPASATVGLGAEVTNQTAQSTGCRVRVDDVLVDAF